MTDDLLVIVTVLGAMVISVFVLMGITYVIAAIMEALNE